MAPQWRQLHQNDGLVLVMDKELPTVFSVTTTRPPVFFCQASAYPPRCSCKKGMNEMIKPIRVLVPLVLVFVAVAVVDTTPARADIAARIAARRSNWYPWHSNYYHAEYGQPVALVIPPTAGNTSEYGWGVGSYRMIPNRHQFGRPYYTGPNNRYRFRPTPAWPSDTTQFGVHYVRSPW